MTQIIKHSDSRISVSGPNGETVKLILDEVTGDWSAMNCADKYPQQTYLRTEDDAIIYALSALEVLQHGSYDVAPDRC